MTIEGLGHPLRDWLANKLVTDVTASATGLDIKTVKSVVAEILTEKSIFEWLLSVNWSGLIQLILTLIALLPK